MCGVGRLSMAVMLSRMVGVTLATVLRMSCKLSTLTAPSTSSLSGLSSASLLAAGTMAFCMRLSASDTRPRAARMSSPSTGINEAIFQLMPSVFCFMSEVLEARVVALVLSESISKLLRSSFMDLASMMRAVDSLMMLLASRKSDAPRAAPAAMSTSTAMSTPMPIFLPSEEPWFSGSLSKPGAGLVYEEA